jgi:hypothetical protein
MDGDHVRRGVKRLFRVVVTEPPTIDTWTVPRQNYTAGTEKGPYETAAPAKAMKTRIENTGGKARIDVTELDWKELGSA